MNVKLDTQNTFIKAASCSWADSSPRLPHAHNSKTRNQMRCMLDQKLPGRTETEHPAWQLRPRPDISHEHAEDIVMQCLSYLLQCKNIQIIRLTAPRH